MTCTALREGGGSSVTSIASKYCTLESCLLGDGREGVKIEKMATIFGGAARVTVRKQLFRFDVSKHTILESVLSLKESFPNRLLSSNL